MCIFIGRTILKKILEKNKQTWNIFMYFFFCLHDRQERQKTWRDTWKFEGLEVEPRTLWLQTLYHRNSMFKVSNIKSSLWSGTLQGSGHFLSHARTWCSIITLCSWRSSLGYCVCCKLSFSYLTCLLLCSKTFILKECVCCKDQSLWLSGDKTSRTSFHLKSRETWTLCWFAWSRFSSTVSTLPLNGHNTNWRERMERGEEEGGV